jgi:hypothetical protein
MYTNLDIPKNKELNSSLKKNLEKKEIRSLEKFKNFMKDKSGKDEDFDTSIENNDTSKVILPSPFQAPINFDNHLGLFANHAYTLPKEIEPLILPLPALIESSNQSNIEKTEIKVQLPSSEFVEILLERYDTDLTSFHISFFGSEEVQKMIKDNQASLINSLQKALPNFGFAISPPFYKSPSFSFPKTKRFGYGQVKGSKEKK